MIEDEIMLKKSQHVGEGADESLSAKALNGRGNVTTEFSGSLAYDAKPDAKPDVTTSFLPYYCTTITAIMSVYFSQRN